MGTNSEKTLALSEPESGLRIPALNMNFNFNPSINPSDVEDLAKKPKFQKLLKLLAKEPDNDDEWQRSIPVKLLKEHIPGFDLEHFIDEIREMEREPGYIKGKEKFFNRLQDPPMSVCPVDVNNPAAPDA
ncbi:unnamed protein product [Arabidopsis arenosa]|uniref:Uncharacterized protein n=1 Tax=Arabidopsis arenosa TaxID=38785 RepID=A0A8S2B6R1_ARAAE|nr:unnamed protein product [Arabidopsis arenosa]CAE6218953.1 unnamed protein product [Arabidopsis arenosa]CAE6218982.1 unnamed protein product [Arabidopsis arenosa]CAE6219023.1 unnamed protein product [Arabidopsis arenosa]CAE6219048.1 unnamed protein product [Arabidopsis arenosa]